MEPLLDDLRKKDPDLQVINDDPNNFIIKTTVNIGTNVEDEEEEEEDEGIVFPRIAIDIRIVRHMYCIHAVTYFLFVIFGVVPYYILSPYRVVSISLLGSSLLTALVLYLLMHCLRTSDTWSTPAFIMWTFNQFVVTCSLASVIGALAPFQAYLIFFVQSISVILLGFFYEKQVDHWIAVACMSLSGACVWGIGLVAFIRDHDWVASGVLLVTSVVIAPAYSGYFISQINKHRYHLGGNELTRALIEFYTEPINWKRTPPSLDDGDFQMI